MSLEQSLEEEFRFTFGGTLQDVERFLSLMNKLIQLNRPVQLVVDGLSPWDEDIGYPDPGANARATFRFAMRMAASAYHAGQIRVRCDWENT